MNGKITITPRQERKGRRLQAPPRRAVWFAREPPWRHGRSALRYRGLESAPHGANLGGTAEGLAFRPMILGRRVFSFALSPLTFLRKDLTAMYSLPLALAASLVLSAPFSPAAVLAAVPEPPAIQIRQAAVPEVPKVYPSSPEGAPVTYELHLPVLMYHHVVHDWQECNEMTVTEGRLERDLQWLAESGYESVLPRELAAGEPLPEKPVLITFDDGYRSNYDLAYPLLQKYQTKGAIAVMAYMQDNPGGNFLTWDMCREMTASGLVEIGSHGYAIHNLDGRMGNFVAGQANGVQRRKGESDTDFYCRVLDDLRYSFDRIAQETGAPPTFFAYPFGKTDPDADAYLEGLFPLTVVTGPGKYAANLSKGLHKLPRFTVTMERSLAALLKNT